MTSIRAGLVMYHVRLGSIPQEHARYNRGAQENKGEYNGLGDINTNKNSGTRLRNSQMTMNL